MSERNIFAFNNDTASHGGYVYTAVERWSSRVATARQTDEIVSLLERNFPRSVGIADLGCGDGTFTIEIARRFRPRHIRGIDPAALAIEAAQRRIPDDLAPSVAFEVGSIYDVTPKQGETVAVIRGVLHHLDDVRAAIAHLATQFPAVIALEPNGYNPMLKLIEKVSTYHRVHDEKSYWPPDLNRWFEASGFSVVSQRCFGLVPYFCPTWVAKVLKVAEPFVEAVPLVKHVSCGTNFIFYKKE